MSHIQFHAKISYIEKVISSKHSSKVEGYGKTCPDERVVGKGEWSNRENLLPEASHLSQICVANLYNSCFSKIREEEVHVDSEKIEAMAAIGCPRQNRHAWNRQKPNKHSKHGKCEGKSPPELGSKDVDGEATYDHSDRKNTVDETFSQESRTDEPIIMFLTCIQIWIEVIIVAGFCLCSVLSTRFAYVASLVDR